MDDQPNVRRDRDIIFIPALTNSFVLRDIRNILYNAVCQRKYQSLILDFAQCDLAFPNVCAPLAGILDFYRNEKFVDFEFQNTPPYLDERVHLKHPEVVGESKAISFSPLDTVWKFLSSQEVYEIVTAFVHALSQADVCEEGVLTALEWCLSETMDNVIQHASDEMQGMQHGYVMAQIHKENKRMAFCVYDYGQGIRNSLKNLSHPPHNSIDAITMAIKEGVTRDKKIGQGNGLWGLQNIIFQNSGLLTITSGDGRISFDGNNFSKKHEYVFLDARHQATIVDFQLDYSKPISITEALNGFTPTNLRVEQFETDHGVLSYKLKDQATGTGTRQSGERIRNEILNLLRETTQAVVIDFTGITVVSSSFADELIGKLVAELGFITFTQRIRMNGMNEIIAPIIDRSVAQRMANLFEQP